MLAPGGSQVLFVERVRGTAPLWGTRHPEHLFLKVEARQVLPGALPGVAAPVLMSPSLWGGGGCCVAVSSAITC